MNRSIDWNDLLFDTAVFAAAIAAALLLHALLVRIAQAAARRTPDSADDKVVARMAPPLRWVLVAIAFAVAGRFLAPDAEGPTWVRQLVGLVIPALIGWLALAGWRAVIDVVELSQYEFAGILRGSKHVEQARLLIDFLVSRRFQEDLPLTQFVWPANRTASVPKEFTDYALRPENPLTIDPATIAAKRAEWLDAFSDVMLR